MITTSPPTPENGYGFGFGYGYGYDVGALLWLRRQVLDQKHGSFHNDVDLDVEPGQKRATVTVTVPVTTRPKSGCSGAWSKTCRRLIRASPIFLSDVEVDPLILSGDAPVLNRGALIGPSAYSAKLYRARRIHERDTFGVQEDAVGVGAVRTFVREAPIGVGTHLEGVVSRVGRGPEIKLRRGVLDPHVGVAVQTELATANAKAARSEGV